MVYELENDINIVVRNIESFRVLNKEEIEFTMKSGSVHLTPLFKGDAHSEDTDEWVEYIIVAIRDDLSKCRHSKIVRSFKLDKLTKDLRDIRDNLNNLYKKKT